MTNLTLRTVQYTVSLSLVAVGVVLLGAVWLIMPEFLPEYQSGLLWSGVLVTVGAVFGGVSWLTSARLRRLAAVAASVMAATALTALVTTGTVARLWIQLIGRAF